MSETVRRARRLAAGGLVLALAAAVVPARADFVFLKDGFVLTGQVKRESTVEVDPITREPFTIPKGFFLLDDGPRRTYFSPTYAREVRGKEAPAEEKLVNKKQAEIFQPRRFPVLREVVDAPEFGTNWERTVKLRVHDGNKDLVLEVPQQVSVVTPYWVRVDYTKYYMWSAAYLTKEMGREQMRELVSSHPFFNEKGLNPKDLADRRFRYVDFFVQAGYLEEAERELKRILADLPAEKAKAEDALARLKTFQSVEKLEEIKRLHLAGRHDEVRKRLAAFPPEKESGPAAAAEVLTLRTDYDNALKKADRLKHFLDTLPKGVAEDKELFAAAAASIKDELLLDGLDKLEPFLGQAEQAERQRKAGKKPELGEAELLSLAMTGWLLGGPSAEAKPAQARRLWRARQLVLDYEKTEPAGRAALLAAFQKQADTPATAEEVAQLIPTLPPPEPQQIVGGQTLELQLGAAQGQRGGPTYLVHVPPEYSHARSYPVLFVLHDGGEKPKSMLRRWEKEADDNGYILVAPEWEPQGGGGFGGGAYNFSDREHQAVIGVLRDLRRGFNVDSDRVFLFGLGQGGLMAWDVGLCHPDLFAGVMPMGAGPMYFAESCWRNGQYLPFLIVNGDRGGDGVSKTREVFDKWVMRGFPMVWTQYKGRGPEWFGAEVPTYFDWMRPKRRAFPLQQLGSDGGGAQFGTELCTMRAVENSFYWLTTNAVSPRCLGTAGPRWPNGVGPATLTAVIDPARNTISLKTTGLKQVTIWLGRTAKGENMVDFTKPVSVTHGLAVVAANRPVKPSLEVLLDDLARRGDRQRLFLAKIDLNF
jgi:hypothetical protein